MVTSMDLFPLISYNPTLAHPLFVALVTSALTTTSNSLHALEQQQFQVPSAYLEVLSRLPPTLPTFDLLGRLLRDPTTIGGTTIADLVRVEVLGRFIHESIKWLDRAENEEREGMISDDRFPKGVQNVRLICTCFLP
jgi:CCR4-NOT transcription complex subunit 11